MTGSGGRELFYIPPVKSWKAKCRQGDWESEYHKDKHDANLALSMHKSRKHGVHRKDYVPKPGTEVQDLSLQFQEIPDAHSLSNPQIKELDGFMKELEETNIKREEIKMRIKEILEDIGNKNGI